MVPLSWYLMLAAFLFSCGLYGALARRNAIAMLMGIELMLNAANINLVAFWRHGVSPMADLTGQVFAVLIIGLAAAEAAVGLALIIAVYRERRTIDVDELDVLAG
ncbi:MAG: NADH-quinone oxidoreductase subunit NuoK [Caldilineaceae bacterium]|nr:NADH-quinone oxidoreductase subunit NuoK [Caldilineaceae bacterium]MCY4092248.1 NADH-quinone oxidoreductase subunit NuoK [Caldilineaceae bacterium]MCY4116197.1 NADH-quinone oxidoreductase subunit NuoK [Caldilineaceae bacterium]MDE0070366.1 NADH-quinone oxidoreductase subunit NuoK [Caldilineaceae bacterium]MDE0180834.1 NADH-quinone oxidoreductase subunit NuoK [Caldilineaceae bacterium]